MSRACHGKVVDVDHETGIKFRGFKPSRHVEIVWKSSWQVHVNPVSVVLIELGNEHDKTLAHRALVTWKNNKVALLMSCQGGDDTGNRRRIIVDFPVSFCRRFRHRQSHHVTGLSRASRETRRNRIWAYIGLVFTNWFCTLDRPDYSMRNGGTFCSS